MQLTKIKKKVFDRKGGIYAKGKPLERFMAHVKVRDNGCWIWDVSNRDNGYVDFVVDGKKIRAHVWSYLFFIGPYDRKLDLDHTCHNNTGCKGGKSCHHRRCVNPYHLQPVTRKENANRGECGHYLSSKTHCKRGHKFTPSNTKIVRGRYRNCRECIKLSYERNK